MRIVFLGDSLTWGGYGGNFVSHVQAALPKHEIINEGIGGDTVINLQWRVNHVLDEHEPDAIFVMVGGNDANSFSQPDTRIYYKSRKGILPAGSITPDQFESAYRDLLTTISLRYVQPLVGLAPTEYSPALIEAKRLFNDRARRVAHQLNIPVLDLDAIFTPDSVADRGPVSLRFIQIIGERVQSGWNDFEAERQREGFTYTFDGMHLTPAAAEDFARHIVPFLKENLKLGE